MTPPPATTAAGRAATTAAAKQRAVAAPQRAAEQHRSAAATRPAGTRAGATRPAGTRAGATRPAGTRAGTTRPAGTRQGTTRPAGTRQGTMRPAGTRQGTTRARTPERSTRRGVSQPGIAPRAPRRVSGPARPVAAGAGAIAAPVTPAAPATPAARPQHSPRPAPVRSAPQPRVKAARRPLGRRLPRLVIAPVRPRERAEALLDRIVRGRAWIPVLAVMLVGVVAMQVEVLKLGASTGRSATLSSELSAQNATLQAAVSSLENPTRIIRLGTAYGLSEPGPTDNRFVSGRTTPQQAINNLHPVDRSAFQSALAQQQAADQQAAASPTTAASTTPAVPGD